MDRDNKGISDLSCYSILNSQCNYNRTKGDDSYSIPTSRNQNSMFLSTQYC